MVFRNTKIVPRKPHITFEVELPLHNQLTECSKLQK